MPTSVATTREQFPSFPLIQSLDEILLHKEKESRTSVELVRDRYVSDYDKKEAQNQQRLQAALCDLEKVFPGGFDLLEKRIEHLKKVRTGAFAIQRKSIDDEIASLGSAKKTVIDLRKTIDEDREALKLYTQLFNEVIGKFPQAELLDLSCLSVYTLPNGLPALALFDVDRPNALISIGSYNGHLSFYQNNDSVPGWRTGELTMSAPREFIEVFAQICKATKVITAREEVVARELGISVDRGYSMCDELKLTADFPGVEIPDEARELISQAKNASFDAVCLLAEVSEWKVEYSTPISTKFKPKIEGNIIRPKDPLILGVKTVNGKLFAFLLGAFNLTGLEEWIKEQSEEGLGAVAYGAS